VANARPVTRRHQLRLYGSSARVPGAYLFSTKTIAVPKFNEIVLYC
jgi:hypothetical protein